jgi:putative CocE/NonD family hydrolase
MGLLTMTGRVCDDGGGNEYLGIKRFGAEEFEENPYEQEAAQNTNQALEAVQEKLQQQQLENLTSALASRPFQQMDVQFGIRQDQFREWIQHWRFDDYWQQRSVLPRLSRTDVPTLHISGWWDANGRGATAFYRGMRDRAATTVNREKQRLLMGAWDHYMQAPDCDDLPPEEASQVERAALRDELNDELAWFDQHLKDMSPGPATAERVTLFITGTYQWLDFDDWPPASTKETTYYLVVHKENGYGCLQPIAADGVTTSSSYTFDPRNPTPFATKDLLLDKAPFDNSQLHSLRKDILIFETPVIDYALALVGEISLVLYASADVPDFDLCAKLVDVYPDGRAIYLADGIIRARFREGWRQPENPQPGTNHRYTLDLWHIGHVLRSGHRLRVELASAAFGRFDVNPCTGTDLATETDYQIANITIQHNITYPSHIILPVCEDARLTNGGS